MKSNLVHAAGLAVALAALNANAGEVAPGDLTARAVSAGSATVAPRSAYLEPQFIGIDETGPIPNPAYRAAARTAAQGGDRPVRQDQVIGA
jgi:hypothetical protein